MNVQETVKQQLSFWHGQVETMMAECDAAVLHKTTEGSTANSIAATYAHAVIAEDAIVQGMLQNGKTPIFESGGWAQKTGIAFTGVPPRITEEWARAVRLDLGVFAPYAQQVYAATEAYLDALTDEETAQKRDGGPFGEVTLGWTVAMLLGTHFTTHAGEIAALKGVHGLKGLAF